MGVLLVLPFLGWAATGFVFYFKPGYGGAYALLQPKTYPLTGETVIRGQPGWRGVRLVRTVLGKHLLVESERGPLHLDPETLAALPVPGAEAVRQLLSDAIASDPARYGAVERVDGLTALTTTGVELTLDWPRLSLRQRGRDTALIDRLYDIHYLRWTGWPTLDKALGFTGLTLVLLMAGSGVWLLTRGSRRKPD